MTAEELKSELGNSVALLSALDTLLPGRIDPEVVQFLDRASKSDIDAQLLHSALVLQTQLAIAPTAKKLKFGA